MDGTSFGTDPVPAEVAPVEPPAPVDLPVPVEESLVQPTQTKYPDPFSIRVHHDYKWDWVDVADDYVAQPGEILGTNWKGNKAKRVNNTESDWSQIHFSGGGLQQIHDDRHEARQVMAADGKSLPKKPDLGIINQHIADAVLPDLTDTDAITSFECEVYPEIAAHLNSTYGLTP